MKELSEHKKRIIAQQKNDEKIRTSLKSHNMKINAMPEVDVRAEAFKLIKPYCTIENTVNDLNSFSYKMKSDSLSKHILKNVHHAFVLYHVPSVLYQAWDLFEQKSLSNYEWNQQRRNRRIYRDYNTSTTSLPPSFQHKAFSIFKKDKDGLNKRVEIDFRQWFICVANGNSLYKNYMSDFFTKKETHTFLNSKIPNFSIEQSLIYAIAICEGASNAIAQKIAHSKIKEKSHLIFTEKHKHQIKYFAQHFPNSLEELNDLWDYVLHGENNVGNLYGQGVSLDTLRKRMKDWHHSLNRKKSLGNHSWEGHPIEDSVYNGANEQGKIVEWSMTQILNTKALNEEGSSQHHCVSVYVDKCKSSACSIWSLKECRNNVFKRVLTIELRNDGSVVQVRGYANRAARPHEKVIVSAWARDNHLYISHY